MAVIARAVQLWSARSVGLAEEALAVTQALGAWAGVKVVTAELYWALVGVAQLYHWHEGIQRRCGLLLPSCQRLLLASPPTVQLPLVTLPGAVVAGAPGGPAYVAAPPPTPAALAAAGNGPAIHDDVEHGVYVAGVISSDEDPDGVAEEEGEGNEGEHEEEEDEEPEEEEEEDDDDEEPADELGVEDEDVKEGEERPPPALDDHLPNVPLSPPLLPHVVADKDEQEEVKEGKEASDTPLLRSSALEFSSNQSHLQRREEEEEEEKEGHHHDEEEPEMVERHDDAQLVAADHGEEGEGDAALGKRWSVGGEEDQAKVAAVDAT